MPEPLLDLMTLTELERRLGRDRVMKVVAAQITNGREMSRRLAALELAPDAVTIKALAHQMAGSSGSIGLLRLSDQAVALELAASDVDSAALLRLVRDLRDCLDASLAVLHAQYPEIVGN
jgi:HPt (histidine-containing phosphotransfer) domain-containing protein